VLTSIYIFFPHQLYINNDELQDPRARAQGGNDSATKHSKVLASLHTCFFGGGSLKKGAASRLPCLPTSMDLNVLALIIVLKKEPADHDDPPTKVLVARTMQQLLIFVGAS
jgi:hypothetical protein